MKCLVALLVLGLVPFTYSQDQMQAPKKQAPTTGSAGFKAEVQTMAEEWKAAFQAKDASKVAALYTEDAVWINPEGTFHGAGDIKSEVQKMVNRGDTVETIVTTKASHSGDLGYAEGTYSGTAPAGKDGAQAPARGSWVVTLKKNNGKWMLATHTSVPGAAAAPMSKSAKKPG
jgi:uncharacterized protein (TIGR02246 family)